MLIVNKHCANKHCAISTNQIVTSSNRAGSISLFSWSRFKTADARLWFDVACNRVLLTVTDVSTTCAAVIFRVKVSCIGKYCYFPVLRLVNFVYGSRTVTSKHFSFYRFKQFFQVLRTNKVTLLLSFQP